MATIRQVANHAGVSTGTVSKVLNGIDTRVHPLTKARILASVRLLRYRPPAFEQNQKAALTHNLAMIVPNLAARPIGHRGYRDGLLDGVIEVAAGKGWSVTIFAETMWDDVGNAVRRKYDGRCDALVVVAPQPQGDLVASLHQRGAPIVQIGTTAWFDDVSSVDIDNEEAGRLIGQHFLDLGHRQIGFLVDHENQVSAQERWAGFRNVAGNCAARFTIGPDDDCFARRFAALGDDRPTALLGWNDGIVARIAPALKEAGLRVPDDVALAGVDDSDDPREIGLDLTTVRNPVVELGRLAANMAIEQVLEHGRERQIIRLKPELIVRTSSASDSFLSQFPMRSETEENGPNRCGVTKTVVR